MLTGLDIRPSLEMAIAGEYALGVNDIDVPAAASNQETSVPVARRRGRVTRSDNDHPVRRCVHRGALGRRNVDAQMVGAGGLAEARGDAAPDRNLPTSPG